MYENIGRQIGNYEITVRLGQGASGEVYLARHTVLTNRIVAIKFLRATFDQTQREQFVKEAHVLEQLKHPHILPIYDIGFYEDCTYLITEYAAGGSLRNSIERSAPGHMSTERIMAILLQTCQALEYAHQHNIVHRDVKPENILLNNAGDVLLADFGTAVRLEPESSEVKLDAVGTPAYLAPERLTGEISKASDQYALGCVAYELFTGRKPFMADAVLEMLRKQREEMPLPLRKLVPELSPAVEQVIFTALAKERKQRFASIMDFGAALEIAVNSTFTDPLKATSRLTAKLPASTVLLQSSITSYEELKDFFITYHNTDRFWAEWIAWQLEDAGYTTIVPVWDFRVGTDIHAEMRKAAAKAKYIIAILSPGYFAIRKNLEEWHTTFRQPVANADERLIPVLVRPCEKRHMKFLHSRVYIDLVECDETVARQLLLASVRHERVKPTLPPSFPGKQPKAATEEPPFPASHSASDQTQFTYQMMPLIRTAFASKDWLDVLQKTSPLLNPKDTHTLSSELYHMHGLALYHIGEVERASVALETALVLETNEEKYLALQKDYSNILTALKQRREVYAEAETILQQVPGGPHWEALRQQAYPPMTRPLKSQSLISAPQGVEVFFSYSHKDLSLRNEIEKYLSNLRRQRDIVGWHDGEIGAGGDWDREIEEHLNRAHIIVLLVSQDFIASDYCYEKEMKRALERHAAREARVIPILLRPAHWEVTPIGKLQALPTGAKPISLWSDRDEAFMDVVRGIQKVVDKLTKPMTLRNQAEPSHNSAS